MSSTREQELIAEQSELLARLKDVLNELADLQTPSDQEQPFVEEQEQEPEPVANRVKIPAGHNFVVVNEGDFVDKLTASGRQLIGKRATFASLEEAQDYARFATERPIYIGEVVLDEEQDAVYTRLKLSYKAALS